MTATHHVPGPVTATRPSPAPAPKCWPRCRPACSAFRSGASSPAPAPAMSAGPVRSTSAGHRRQQDEHEQADLAHPPRRGPAGSRGWPPARSRAPRRRGGATCRRPKATCGHHGHRVLRPTSLSSRSSTHRDGRTDMPAEARRVPVPTRSSRRPNRPKPTATVTAPESERPSSGPLSDQSTGPAARRWPARPGRRRARRPQGSARRKLAQRRPRPASGGAGASTRARAAGEPDTTITAPAPSTGAARSPTAARCRTSSRAPRHPSRSTQPEGPDDERAEQAGLHPGHLAGAGGEPVRRCQEREEGEAGRHQPRPDARGEDRHVGLQLALDHDSGVLVDDAPATAQVRPARLGEVEEVGAASAVTTSAPTMTALQMLDAPAGQQHETSANAGRWPARRPRPRPSTAGRRPGKGGLGSGCPAKV